MTVLYEAPQERLYSYALIEIDNRGEMDYLIWAYLNFGSFLDFSREEIEKNHIEFDEWIFNILYNYHGKIRLSKLLMNQIVDNHFNGDSETAKFIAAFNIINTPMISVLSQKNKRVCKRVEKNYLDYVGKIIPEIHDLCKECNISYESIGEMLRTQYFDNIEDNIDYCIFLDTIYISKSFYEEENDILSYYELVYYMMLDFGIGKEITERLSLGLSYEEMIINAIQYNYEQLHDPDYRGEKKLSRIAGIKGFDLALKAIENNDLVDSNLKKILLDIEIDAPVN
jgi:hypothetical protein